ncbi:hypothetical protein MIMGU_mgv1a016102mg [Erythranthe guttata]|uniref:Uncharacterized protein n=1 Tax=Erythranthe guttata TaxID=4155 RepID=A0A022QVN1_ERYGU|nr:hypothetical protein MIMGU_mgv1a016102mg [Erythranthe guttata]
MHGGVRHQPHRGTASAPPPATCSTSPAPPRGGTRGGTRAAAIGIRSRRGGSAACRRTQVSWRSRTRGPRRTSGRGPAVAPAGKQTPHVRLSGGVWWRTDRVHPAAMTMERRQSMTLWAAAARRRAAGGRVGRMG